MKKIVLDTCTDVQNVLGILYALTFTDIKALLLRDDKENHYNLEKNLAFIHKRNPKEIKIAWGSSTPIVDSGHKIQNYMDILIDEGQFPMPHTEKEMAWDVLYETAKEEGKITIVTLSTLTNIAIALFKYEDLKDYIEEIVIMGGSTEEGNVGPFSEANFAADAYGAEAVISSGIPVRIIGLNAACKSKLTEPEIKLTQLERIVIDKLSANPILYPYKNAVVFHDVLTLMAVCHPDLFGWENYPVSVEYRSDLALGRLNVDIRRHCDDIKNGKVAIDVDKESYRKQLEKDLGKM